LAAAWSRHRDPGLAFLILVHEAGHFFASLAVGLRPRRFYIGFPPAIAKTMRGGIVGRRDPARWP
jgi:membrane-associated protease RseP (regulator of RpoE activity)